MDTRIALHFQDSHLSEISVALFKVDNVRHNHVHVLITEKILWVKENNLRLDNKTHVL